MPADGRRVEVVNVATDTYSATEVWLPGSHLIPSPVFPDSSPP